MHPTRILAACLLAGFVPIAAAADVYKCSREGGEVIFTDRPCPPDARTEAVPQRAREVAAADTSDTERVCATIAEPLWALQPLEAGGQLTDEQTLIMRTTRERLRSECAMRLAVSALAHECRDRTLQVTAAVQRAADTRRDDELARVEAEYDARCNDEARIDDILRHLRQLEPGER
jgi:hypothetical protein